MSVATRDEKGLFVPGNEFEITTENAKELQKRSVAARHGKIVDAVKSALAGDKKLPWELGLRDVIYSLVEVGLDPESTGHEKARVSKELREWLGVDVKLGAGPAQSVENQYNLNMTPDDARSILAMRCPDCGDLMKPGVQHDCDVVDA